MVKKVMDILFCVMFAFYIFMLLDLFFRFQTILDREQPIMRNYNFIPFHTIWGYVGGRIQVPKALAIQNVLGNVAVFVPYGLYVQTLRKRKTFPKSLLIVTLTSVGIETIQFIFGLGSCDIDDVLLNCCGGIMGILLYMLLRRICKEEGRTKNAITVISLLVGIPILYVFFSTVFFHLK